MHARTEEAAAKVIGCECSIQYVEEYSRRRNYNRTYDLWIWTDEPRTIPRGGPFAITSADEEGLPTDIPLPDLEPLRNPPPSEPKKGWTYNVLVHVDIPLKISSPAKHVLTSGIMKSKTMVPATESTHCPAELNLICQGGQQMMMKIGTGTGNAEVVTGAVRYGIDSGVGPQVVEENQAEGMIIDREEMTGDARATGSVLSTVAEAAAPGSLVRLDLLSFLRLPPRVLLQQPPPQPLHFGRLPLASSLAQSIGRAQMGTLLLFPLSILPLRIKKSCKLMISSVRRDRRMFFPSWKIISTQCCMKRRCSTPCTRRTLLLLVCVSPVFVPRSLAEQVNPPGSKEPVAVQAISQVLVPPEGDQASSVDVFIDALSTPIQPPLLPAPDANARRCRIKEAD